LSATITVAQAERVAGGFLFVHLFDGDKEGSMASARLRKLLPNSKHIIRYLPDREDPDSMVRKFGVEALAEIIRPVLESPG